jgi:excisionase family DNA binding protein
MSTQLLYSIPDACSIARTGRTSLYEAIRTGALRAVKRGRRTLILHEDLLRYVQSLPPVVLKSIEQSTREGAT